MSPRGYHLEAIFASHFDQSHPRSCDECRCSKCNGSPSRFSSEFLDEIIRYRWIYIAALLQVTLKALRYGSHSFTCKTNYTIPASIA